MQDPDPTGTCSTCQRLLTSRECSDPAHRAARGFVEGKADFRRCPKCNEWKPLAKFWGHGRNSYGGHLFEKCGECRFKARQGRQKYKRAQWRIEKAASDAFWASQRERELSTPGSP